MDKTYRLFISHSWKYGEMYDRLVELLGEQRISFYDHSVPKNDPTHTNGTDLDLLAAID
ncbi:MAG: hypothetical protein AAED33_06340 [Paracoccaceae bacterium]|jgi:hypothetical protein